MERIALGDSGITVSKLCFGTGTIARREGWAPEAAAATVDLIRFVLDRGCNFIDTAPSYCMEEVVGRAIRGRRDQVVVATKIGHLQPEEVGPSLEASLRSLGTDYVDLCHIHWPHPPLEPLLEELVRQRDAGKIRAIGISNFSLAQTQVAAEYGVANSQPPYSILWRTPKEILSLCRMRGISVTAYSPLAEGILTGRFTRKDIEIKSRPIGNALVSEEVKADSFRVAALLDRVADRAHCTSTQAALAWVLQTPGISSLVVQASQAARWEENIAALELCLPQEDYEELDRAGFEVWNRFGQKVNLWGRKVD